MFEEEQNPNQRKHEQANNDVRGVKAHQGIERGPKKIGSEGESVFVDQPVPFDSGKSDKAGSQKDRESQ